MSIEDEQSELLRDLPPLVHAAAGGNLEDVWVLLTSGAQINEADGEGWTALHAAAARRQPQIVEALLAAGADPNVADAAGFTPLLNAAGPGDPASVQALIGAGADVAVAHPTYGWSPLSRAAEWDNSDVLILLLRAGADPNQSCPLISAAEAGSLRCTQELVAAGADHTVRLDGHTAADYARKHQHSSVAAFLDRLATA